MTEKIAPRKWVPEYEGTLRSHMIKIPTCISECSGIRVFGRRIKSLAFTTDVAVIRNINADAVMAVYPFTPQPAIHRAVMQAADMPVFVGVGGGVTRGLRVVNLANDAEHEGAFGVVVNAPTQNDVVRRLKQVLDIPVVVTVVSHNTDIAARLEQAHVSVSSLCIASAVPPTTALRWIRTLTDKALVERRADPHDGRRIFIALADDAAEKLMRWFSASHRYRAH